MSTASILCSIGIIGLDIGPGNSYGLMLCLLAGGLSMIPDFIQSRGCSNFQPVLGLATVLTALIGLAYGLAQHTRTDRLYPGLLVALAIAGMMAYLKGRSKNTLSVQFCWLILFVVVFGGFVANVLSMVLGLPLFDYMLRSYGMSHASSAALLMLCMVQLHSLRHDPATRRYYEKRRDRQIVAQQVVLILSLGLVAGIGGAGLLAKDSMRGMRASLVDALQANSQNFVDTVGSAVNNSEKIASLMSMGEGRDRVGRLLELHKKDGMVSIRVTDRNGTPVASVGGGPDMVQPKVRLNGGNSWLVWQDGLNLLSDSPYYRNGRRIGDIEVQTSLKQLDREFDRTQSFGKSGEVVLCASGADRMNCFPSSLHREASRLPHWPESDALLMSYALHGQSGVTVGYDNRDRLVLAAYQPLRDLGLGLVQKIDFGELFAPAKTQMFYAFFFLMVSSGFAAWLLYRRTHPLVHDLIVAEAHSRTILDNVPEAVVTTDGKGVIRSLNLSARKIFGPGDVEGGKEFPLLKGLSVCASGNCLQDLNCIEGECSGIDGEARRQDGSVFPYEMAVGEFGFDGEKHFVCVVRDLTERKQAETMLRERERYTRHLLENIQTGVVVYAQDGSVNYLNAAARRFFGFDSTLAGMHIPNLFLRFLREDGSAMPVEALPENRVLADGQPFCNDVVGIQFEEGAPPRWALVNGFPDVDESGAIREVIISFIDITDRKHAEQAVIEAGEKLARLNRLYLILIRVNEATVRIRDRESLFGDVCNIMVDSGKFVMAWIGLLDEAGEIIPVVHAGHDAGYLDLLKKTGLMALNGPASLVLKTGIAQICPDIANDPGMAAWRKEAARRGYRSSAGFPLHLGDKRIGLINVYSNEVDFFKEDIVSLMQEIVGDVSFAIGYLDQQNRREQAEALLRQVNSELEERVQMRTRQLEAANTELAAFSYSVSHDLRAPLRSIDGFSEILLKRHAAQLDDTALDYLARVRRATRRMGELIEDLLQLSSVTRSEIRREKVDLSKIVGSVIGEFDAGKRHVEWAIQPDVRVIADARLMKIAMENLIGNAWKFTSARNEAKIEFGVFEQGGEKILYVRDNGAGFDMKYAGKLFGAFQRLHKTEEFEGTGIGLATVQRIVRRHGGRIWAEGEVNVGAAFYFTL